MERHLRAQFERLLAEGDDRREGEAVRPLRARLAADIAAALEQDARVSSESIGQETDTGDLVRAAAYLDGQLVGEDWGAFLRALAASPRRRADVESAAALLAAIEAEPKTAPADLLARAGSTFADRSGDSKNIRRGFLSSRRAVRWSLVTLALLILLPGGIVFFGGRADRPFGVEAPSSSLDATPGRMNGVAAEPPAPSPALPKKSASEDAPAQAPAATDVARSERGCEPAASPHSKDAGHGFAAEKNMESVPRAIPCPSAPPGTQTLGARGIDSEHGAAASHRGFPLTGPSAISPSAR
jgi:hypothetical protein